MGIVKEYAGLVSLVCVLVLGGVVLTSSPTEVMGGKGVSDFSSVNVKSGGAYTLADTSVIDSSRNGSFVTLTATGDATLGSGYIKSTGSLIEQSVSSTLKVGNDASGLASGCLVLGDSAGATSSPVYITASGSTVTASTTRPAICR